MLLRPRASIGPPPPVSCTRKVRTMARAISSWMANTSCIRRAKVSDQRYTPVAVSMSWARTRKLGPAMRTLPVSTVPTCNCSRMERTSCCRSRNCAAAFHAYDRVHTRIVGCLAVEYFHADHVFLQLVGLPGERALHRKAQESDHAPGAGKKLVRQNFFQLLPDCDVGKCG